MRTGEKFHLPPDKSSWSIRSLNHQIEILYSQKFSKHLERISESSARVSDAPLISHPRGIHLTPQLSHLFPLIKNFVLLLRASRHQKPKKSRHAVRGLRNGIRYSAVIPRRSPFAVLIAGESARRIGRGRRASPRRAECRSAIVSSHCSLPGIIFANCRDSTRRRGSRLPFHFSD